MRTKNILMLRYPGEEVRPSQPVSLLVMRCNIKLSTGFIDLIKQLWQINTLVPKYFLTFVWSDWRPQLLHIPV